MPKNIATTSPGPVLDRSELPVLVPVSLGVVDELLGGATGEVLLLDLLKPEEDEELDFGWHLPFTTWPLQAGLLELVDLLGDLECSTKNIVAPAISTMIITTSK